MGNYDTEVKPHDPEPGLHAMAGAAGSGSEVVKRLRLQPVSGRPHLVIGTVAAAEVMMDDFRVCRAERQAVAA